MKTMIDKLPPGRKLTTLQVGEDYDKMADHI